MAGRDLFRPATRGRPTPFGRVLLVVLGAVVLVGCTSSLPQPALSVRVDSPPTAAGASELLTLLTAARHDAVRWARLIDSADPGFPTEAERLRANLDQFSVELTLTGRTHDLSTTRFRQLGPSARAHGVRVRWAVPGEPTPAEHIIWLTVTNSAQGARLSGVKDGPPERASRPIWWEKPVRVHRRDAVALITGPETDPDPWLATLATATATLAERDLRLPLVVAEIPASAADFEQMLGVVPGSYRQVAATAWPFGSTVHIVVNPEAVPAQAAARQVLLTHEAVHVATGSVGRDLPLWLVEGYADLVALADQPEVTAEHRRQLAEDQRTHGVATGLVSAAELAPDHPRVGANYQRAWLAVSVLDRGSGSAGRVHRAVGAGIPLDRALAAEAWTEADLEAAVHSELQQLAERP